MCGVTCGYNRSSHVIIMIIVVDKNHLEHLLYLAETFRLPLIMLVVEIHIRLKSDIVIKRER